jgi:hypothetical protein
LLEAVPRIYQVTPDIPDRRRATQQDGSQTADLADSLKESQLAAGREPPFSVGRHRHPRSKQQASKRQLRPRRDMIWPMRHQRVVWQHELEDEPTVLWSEIGDDGYELRKVDEYRDGRFDTADARSSTGSTLLGDQKVPSLDEINRDAEFTGTKISQGLFETIWDRATRG